MLCFSLWDFIKCPVLEFFYLYKGLTHRLCGDIIGFQISSPIQCAFVPGTFNLITEIQPLVSFVSHSSCFQDEKIVSFSLHLSRFEGISENFYDSDNSPLWLLWEPEQHYEPQPCCSMLLKDHLFLSLTTQLLRFMT